MVTKIIQVGDIHIRNFQRSDEYHRQLLKFIDECKKIVDENGVEETRIVVCGDLLHSKTEISPEGYAMASWFLRQLDGICKTIVFAGNHDINTNNSNNRLDPLSVIFSMSNFNRVYYLDKELEYNSGCIEDDNIIWCLYSAFSDYMEPNILDMKDFHFRSGIQDSNFTYIGLYHGDVKSARTDTGDIRETGKDGSYFELVDFALLGHVHKRQCIETDGIKLVYSGSLIQQNHGENISGHGYVLWDVQNQTYEGIDIPNPDNGFYTITVNSDNDIDDDKEEFINI